MSGIKNRNQKEIIKDLIQLFVFVIVDYFFLRKINFNEKLYTEDYFNIGVFFFLIDLEVKILLFYKKGNFILTLIKSLGGILGFVGFLIIYCCIIF